MILLQIVAKIEYIKPFGEQSLWSWEWIYYLMAIIILGQYAID